MIQSGLLEETKALLKKGYSKDLPTMKSIGYRHVIEYFSKKYSLEETIHNLQRDTRRYSKRQITWFRSDTEMIWVDPDDRSFIEKKIDEFL